MSRSAQQSLTSVSDEFSTYWKASGRRFHGGSHAKGKRKTKRPLDTKRPIHLVLSSKKAKGSLSFLSPLNKNKVDRIVHEYAHRFGIRIYDYSNSGDHLHLQLKISSREQFQRYLRTITGVIARMILKAKKGIPKGKFWSAPAFTRIADWGKGFKNLRKYIFRNVLEASGVIPYDRKNLKFVPLISSG
jgi:REP element-mobilizing transposase RayT